jgi:MFS superfamily sulfate permease-like transporter
MIKSVAQTVFPFLRWFPVTRATLRADLVAGVTVALVLVPQSMAYAQLAGLPVVYGLYASFVPVIVASLWGSSSQLHTGPVAMLSLMSAAALMSFATPGTTDFIELSIMLALMVGVLRLALGVFRLGAIVNLLSSPVIVGFTNAAALIIGLSQLSKVIGVPFPRSESYLGDAVVCGRRLAAGGGAAACFAGRPGGAHRRGRRDSRQCGHRLRRQAYGVDCTDSRRADLGSHNRLPGHPGANRRAH